MHAWSTVGLLTIFIATPASSFLFKETFGCPCVRHPSYSRNGELPNKHFPKHSTSFMHHSTTITRAARDRIGTSQGMEQGRGIGTSQGMEQWEPAKEWNRDKPRNGTG